MNFQIENPRSRVAAFWGGLSLILVGVVLAAIGIWSVIRERAIHRDLESMVRELRASGAIVENYYEILTNKEPRISDGFTYGSIIAAGVLVAAGASMMVIARKQAADNASSGGAGASK